MRTLKPIILSIIFVLGYVYTSYACPILYYIDKGTGKIYAVNSEDFWLDAGAYIQIEKKSKDKLARLWYGWDNFAQGGINSAGLFFDVAVTPEQEMPQGYDLIKGNIGDKLLSEISTVEQAIEWMEKEKFAVHQSHFLIGDASGNAVIVEWIDGKKHIIRMEGNSLIATNYLINAPEEGGFPCYRFESIQERIAALESSDGAITLKSVGQTFEGAVVPMYLMENGKKGGTLYTSFFDIADMKMVLVPKLDNSKAIVLDLKEEFEKGKKRRIDLE